MPSRSKSLICEPIEDELLIYAPDRQESHCLNPLSRRIFEHCDGQTPLAEVAGELDQGVVELALDQLRDKGLIQGWQGPASSRRKFLKAVALPAIISVLAPAPAAAASLACRSIGVAGCAALGPPNLIAGRRFSNCAEGCKNSAADTFCPSFCGTSYCANPLVAGDCTSDDLNNPNSVGLYCGPLFNTGNINQSCVAGRAAAVATFFNQLSLQCASGLDSGSFNCPTVSIQCPSTGTMVNRRMFEYFCCDCSA